jgi:SNF2 family DNA or RNA helicase
MDFGSYNAFYEQFCAYEVDQYGFKHVTGPNNVAELQHLLYGEGRAVRHVRTEVLPEIPGKYYTYYPIDMTHKQRRAYNEMRDQQLAWIGALGDEPIAAPVAIAKLIRMGQFASAYAEFNDEGKLRLSEPSNKLDALMEILEGRRLPVVVFSVSTQLLALAARRMAAKGYRVGTIQGGVPEAKRTELARMFQAGELDILLCQTRAGGVSITLTRASTAIMLDRDWAPGANSQGEDRLDRWGQLEKVEVIILQSTGTVDMRKERTVQTKKGWIKEMLDDRH